MSDLKLPVYMDHLATTPVDRRVLDAMLPYFCDAFGNASSATHSFGNEAAIAVAHARRQVALLLGAREREIVFTSGATEANNLAIKGVAAFYGRGHLITAKTEHKAVLDVCKYLQGNGFEVTYLDVDREGRIDTGALDQAIRDDTILVSLMAANNEVGTIHPLAQIGALCKARNVLWHCDGAQAAGKIALDVEEMGIDLLSLSAHKFYGPKGVGALYVRSRSPRVRLCEQLVGGNQERGLRAGTLNVPGIVGLGMACELAAERGAEEAQRLLTLRARLLEGIKRAAPDCQLNGPNSDRLPGHLSLSFAGVDGAELLAELREVALSSGAACSSDAPVPSHVLAAMGRDDSAARSTLRFGLGRFTTEREVDFVAERVVEAVGQLRVRSGYFAKNVVSKNKKVAF